MFGYHVNSDSLLTQEQRNWLLGISRDNTSVGNIFPSVTTNQLQQLSIKNELFVNDTTMYHLPYHYSNDIIFSNYNKTNIVQYDDCGDSGFWTAHYIAYLAHRWNITADTTILNEIHNEIYAYYNLITCAERIGYLVRMLGKADDIYYKAYYSGYTAHFQCSDTSPTLNSSYIWLGGAARDQYFAGAMMLTVLWTHIYSNDNMNNSNIYIRINDIRNMVYNISELMINDLYSNNWWIVNSAPDYSVPVNPDPLLKCVWMRLGMTLNPTKYIPLFQDEYNDKFQESVETLEMDLTSLYHSGYFANNLRIIAVSSLGYLETNTSKLIILFNRLQDIAVKKGKYHLQATYSSWFLSVAESHKYELEKLNVTKKNLDIAIGILQGTMLDFPDNTWDKYVNQDTNPLYFPHHNDEMSEYALLPHDRPINTYLWQKSPAQLAGGSNRSEQYKMTDFLLPYWTAKYVKVL